MLAKAQEYVGYAKDALALVADEPDPAGRHTLLQMAETWLFLATAAAQHQWQDAPAAPVEARERSAPDNSPRA